MNNMRLVGGALQHSLSLSAAFRLVLLALTHLSVFINTSRFCIFVLLLLLMLGAGRGGSEKGHAAVAGCSGGSSVIDRVRFRTSNQRGDSAGKPSGIACRILG